MYIHTQILTHIHTHTYKYMTHVMHHTCTCKFTHIIVSYVCMLPLIVFRSLSFILVMGGTASVVFIFFCVMIDALNFWNGSPFRYPGESQECMVVMYVICM